MIQRSIIIFFIFVLLIAGFLHPITSFTQDLGRHLLMGEIILKTYSVPQTNLFSYTHPDFPFINTHWLSEVIFYLTHKLIGFNGLLLISTVIVSLSFGLVFFTAIKKGSVIAITIISILYLRILFERTDIRPEIFSFLFLSIFITILYKYRQRYTLWILLLPFLELVWVNTHIYFPIGIAVIGLFLLEQIILLFYQKVQPTKFSQVANRGNTNQGHKTNTWSIIINNLLSSATRKFLWTNENRIIVLLSIFVASLSITLLNPNGIAGALYPFHVFQNYGYQIEENQTVFFLWDYFGGKTTILYFFISAAVLFSTLLLTIKKSRPIDWLLALFFTYLAANAERNMPLFVFGTFIPCTYALSIIARKIKLGKRSHLIKGGVTFVLIGTIIWNINNVVQQKGFGLGTAKGAERGADFFLENNLKGPLFNNFDIGSYLDYRLYPTERLFIDGRPEAYPSSFLQNIYIPMQNDPKLFGEQDKKYHFNAIFFSHTDMTPWAQTFLKWITQDKQWSIVYLDDYVIILLKNTSKNAELIKKHGLLQSSLRISNFEQTDKTTLLRLINFFHLVGWPEQREKMYQQLLIVDPNNCVALYNLSLTNSIYTQRLQQSCQ